MSNYAQYDDYYNGAEAKTGSAPLPDGNYTAEIVEVKMGQWKDGSDRVEWTFRVTGGDYDGRTTWMNGGMDEKKIGRTKGHFDCLGLAGLSFSQVVAQMPSLTGRVVDITISTFNDKSYTHMNGPSKSQAAAAPAPTPPVAAPVAAPKQADLTGIPANSGIPY